VLNENPKRSPWRSLARNVSALALGWLLSFAAVQFAGRVVGASVASPTAQTLACGVAILLALQLAAKPAAFFFAAMLAFSVSELLVHGYYGVRAAQGAPTHFAVMGAGLLGVALGALLASKGNTRAKLHVSGEESRHTHAHVSATSGTRRTIEVSSL
jgi:hypothetical protein